MMNQGYKDEYPIKSDSDYTIFNAHVAPVLPPEWRLVGFRPGIEGEFRVTRSGVVKNRSNTECDVWTVEPTFPPDNVKWRYFKCDCGKPHHLYRVSGTRIESQRTEGGDWVNSFSSLENVLKLPEIDADGKPIPKAETEPSYRYFLRLSVITGNENLKYRVSSQGKVEYLLSPGWTSSATCAHWTAETFLEEGCVETDSEWQPLKPTDKPSDRPNFMLTAEEAGMVAAILGETHEEDDGMDLYNRLSDFCFSNGIEDHIARYNFSNTIISNKDYK